MSSVEIAALIRKRVDEIAQGILDLPDDEAGALANWIPVVLRWREVDELNEEETLLAALAVGYVLGTNNDPRLLRIERSEASGN